LVEREAIVGPEEGLHARPAAQFVKAAKAYSSDVRVIKDDTVANAESSLNLMTLGATQGDELLIRSEGEDEEAAAETPAELLSRG